MDFEDLDINVSRGMADYTVTLRSSSCVATGSMPSFEPMALENRRIAFQLAVQRMGRRTRRVLSSDEQVIRTFGTELFSALFPDETRTCLDASRMEAARSARGIRIRLHLDEAPELRGLPWESLYDARDDRFLALSVRTPIVRYHEVANPAEPPVVGLPLRTLGLVANSSDLGPIDVEHERLLLERALSRIVAQGRLSLTWLDRATPDAFREAMRDSSWNIVHVVGSGAADRFGSGIVTVADDAGRPIPLSARRLSELIDDQGSLRLVVLAAAEELHGDLDGPFAATAAELVGRRTPAVLSVGSHLTDDEAIQFFEELYRAVVEGVPIDAAVAEARKALLVIDSLAWGVPLLDTQIPDGVLFHIDPAAAQATPPIPIPTTEIEQRAHEALRRKNAETVAKREAEEQERTGAALEAARQAIGDSIPDYDDLKVRIGGRPDGSYHVEARGPDGGLAEGAFLVPFNDVELENFVLKVGQARRSTRKFRSDDMEAAKAFGTKLLDALFPGDVRGVYQAARELADSQDHGLRISLSLTLVPELMNIPWEFVWDRRFIAQSIYTPIIRSLDLKELRPPRKLKPPLRILGIVSRPRDFVRLNVAAERRKLERAIAPLDRDGLVALEWLPHATLAELERRIGAPDEVHVLHFIGHGGYDDHSESGVLIFEDDRRDAVEVGGDELCAILHDERSLQLAVLNSCEGARTSHVDPFSGVASALAECGIPAVIGMQFEITDTAAIAFSERLYTSLGSGFPVDAAVGQARKGIFAAGNNAEFGTPVLVLRATETRLFEIQQLDHTAPV